MAVSSIRSDTRSSSSQPRAGRTSSGRRAELPSGSAPSLRLGGRRGSRVRVHRSRETFVTLRNLGKFGPGGGPAGVRAGTCSAGRPTRRRRSACSTHSSTPGSTSSTPPTSTRDGRRATRGAKSETILGRWFRPRGASGTRSSLATKVGMEDGPGEGRACRRAYIKSRKSSGRSNGCGTDRDRPLPVRTRTTSETPLEETLWAFSEPDRAGQGPRDRGLELLGRSAQARPSQVSKDQQGLAAYTCLQPHYNLAERSLFEDALEESLPRRRAGRDPVLRAWPPGSSRASTAPRPTCPGALEGREGAKKYLNERGFGHPPGPRRGGRPARVEPFPGGPGLAGRPAGRSRRRSPAPRASSSCKT